MDKKSLLTLATYQTGISSPKGFCSGIYAKGSYSIPQGFSPATTKNATLSTCKTTLPHSITLTNVDKTDSSLSKSVGRNPKKVAVPKLSFQMRQAGNSNIETMMNKIPSLKAVTLNEDSDEKRNNLEHYLNYLGSSSREELDSFRKKMKPKNKIVKTKVIKLEGEEEAWMSKLIKHDPKDKMNTTQESSAMASPKRFPRLPYLSMNSQAEESTEEDLTSTPYNVPKRTITFTALKMKPSLGGLTYTDRQTIEKSKFFSTTEENPVAAELAEEICRKYKLLQDNQTIARESRKKVQEVFENEGVVKIFVPKDKKQPAPLLLRIFNDMVENLEVISALRRADSKSSALLAKTPQSHKSSSSNCRLIQERYDTYKRVNSSLEEIILSYKIQGLKRLGSSLLKAREDLKIKEKGLRQHLGRASQQGYIARGREKSQIFEESLVSFNYEHLGEKIDRLQKNYGDSVRVDEANKLVNKELSEIMKNYTTKLRTSERINSIC